MSSLVCSYVLILAISTMERSVAHPVYPCYDLGVIVFTRLLMPPPPSPSSWLVALSRSRECFAALTVFYLHIRVQKKMRKQACGIEFTSEAYYALYCFLMTDKFNVPCAEAHTTQTWGSLESNLYLIIPHILEQTSLSS